MGVEESGGRQYVRDNGLRVAVLSFSPAWEQRTYLKGNNLIL